MDEKNYEWSKKEKKTVRDNGDFSSFYRRLIELRKEKKVISEGSIEFLERENADVLAYKRAYEKEEIIVFNNLTGKEITVQMQPEWKEYHKLLGNYPDDSANIDGEKLVLRPYETLSLEA